MATASIKGHQSKSNETILVVAGLLFKFTIVKMRGPNKQLNHKKNVLAIVWSEYHLISKIKIDHSKLKLQIVISSSDGHFEIFVK